MQALSLGASSDNDSLATISLAEIGGIPQSGATNPLDPNLLIGLSPETLNMMTTSFQFLPSTSSTNDLTIGPPGADIPNCTVSELDTLTTHSSEKVPAVRTSVANSLPTHPVMSCLNTMSSERVNTNKDSKSNLGPAIPLEVDSVCSDPSVVTIINSAIVHNSQGVSGVNGEPSNTETTAISHREDAAQSKASETLNLFDDSLEARTSTLSESSGNKSQGTEESPEPVPVEAFLNDGRPGPSQDSMSLALSNATNQKEHSPNTLISLSSTSGTVSEGGVQATETHPVDETCGQNSLMVSSGNNVQYVSITVPNVEINSSGKDMCFLYHLKL